MIPLATGGFGKLPAHGDFLRLHGDPRATEPIERWCAGIDLRPESNPRAVQAFDASGPVLCVHGDAARGVYYGVVLFPSRDTVGRRFPFCIYGRLEEPGLADHAALVPALFMPFFQRVFAAGVQQWPTDPDELRRRIAALAGGVDVADEERRLVASLDALTNRRIWHDLFGASRDPRKYHLIANLMAAAGAGDADIGDLRIVPMQHQSQLYFWLLLTTLLRDSGKLPALVAMHPAAGGQRPSATIVWHHPRQATGAAALWPTCSPEHGNIVDLVEGYAHPATLAPGLRALLDDRDLPAREVVHGIVSAHRAR